MKKPAARGKDRRPFSPMVVAVLGGLFVLASACASPGGSGPEAGTAISGPVVTIRVALPPGTPSGVAKQTFDVIAARAASFHGATTHDGDTIVVTVPSGVGVAAAHLLAQPGEVQFRAVLGEYPPEASPTDSSQSNCWVSSTAPECLLMVPTSPDLTSAADLADPDARNRVVVVAQVDPSTDKTVAIFKLSPVLLDHTALIGATADSDTPNGQWQVNPVFKDGKDGIDSFNTIAAHCYASDAACPQVGNGASHGQLAVVLDDHVVTAPSIDAPSFTKDEIRISGAFDEASAKTVAALLSSGPLPVEVTATTS